MADDTKNAPVPTAERTDRAQWTKPVLSRLDAEDAEGVTNNGGDGGVFS